MSNFTEDETEVADIILRLPRLVLERELASRVSFNWGFRRRRSGLLSAATENDNRISNRVGDEAKTEASSPATPLSFPPSESDGKRSPSRKSSKREKRSKKIEDLMKQRESLRKALEDVKRFYDKVVAHNLELKAKKDELANSIHYKPWMMDRTARMDFGDLPDLNVAVEESLMADCCEELTTMPCRRKIASEARRRRILIYRAKKSFVSANNRLR